MMRSPQNAEGTAVTIPRLLGVVLACALTLVTMLVAPARAERIAAVGDISPPPWEAGTHDHQTARLVRSRNYDRVIAAGDTQYQDGREAEYRSEKGWVEPGGWATLDPILWPVGGNHEGADPAGFYAGFCAYFTSVGRPTGCNSDVDGNGHPDGIWSATLNGWTFIFLNSSCGDQPGSMSCASGSPQYWWLNHRLKYVARELDPGAQCTALVFHEPFKSSPAPYWGEPKLTALWSLGVKHHVDLAISAHNHAQEQLKPHRASGIVDYDFGPGDGDDGLAGIRAVISGGGGRSRIGYSGVDHRSLYRQVKYGVWEMDVRPGSWAGRFRYVDGSVEFSTSIGCH